MCARTILHGCSPTQLQVKVTEMQRQQTVVDCPRSMVGRVIGKGGETIKALQQYTGAMIQIDQSCEPTKVTVAGSAQSLQLAVSMVRDIVAGNFKGFALLRQLTSGTGPQLPQGYEQFNQAQPVYVEGYGFVPPSQVRSHGDKCAGFFSTDVGVRLCILGVDQGILQKNMFRSRVRCVHVLQVEPESTHAFAYASQ